MTLQLSHPPIWKKTSRQMPAPSSSLEASRTPQRALTEVLGDALSQARPDDAVRLFIRAVEEGVLPRDDSLRAVAREMLGDQLLGGIIIACAGFACPYCTRGFMECEHCGGKGRTDRTLACRECRTLGARPCEFCAGSGWAGYSFFPDGITVAVATVRIERAIGTLKSLIASAGLRSATRHGLIELYGRLSRVHAACDNGLHLLRSSPNKEEATVVRLAASAWRGLTRSEGEMSDALTRLAASPLPASADEGRGTPTFEDDRRSLLEEEAARLAESARARADLLKHRSPDRA